MKTNCGIYKIINLKNGKIYIGSSFRLRQRKHEHFKYLKNNRHCNTHLQNSYNKYGKENFIFEVIEYVELTEDRDTLKDNLLNKEQYWLDNYFGKNCYNLCPNAYSKLGSKDSPETIAKRVASCTGKKRTSLFRKRMSRRMKGNLGGVRRGGYRVFSEEHVANLRESHKNKKFSEETKRRMSESHKNRDKEVQDRMNENHKKKIINIINQKELCN